MSQSTIGVTSAVMPGFADIKELRRSFTGQLLLPEDEGYDAARAIWNAMIDRRPATIARCQNASDIQRVVQFGAAHEIPISIKGGGHNVAGNALCSGGITVDLSEMKRIDVDAQSKRAWAQPGVLWQEFDRATQLHGLATVGGVVGTTGIAGLTLGGGQGWLTGKYGLSLDNLVSAKLVTADGELRHVSAGENPDLFWAIRGAGANFGVVSEFEFALHPVSTVFGGLIIYSLDRAQEVLRTYRAFAISQPDELTTYAAVLTGPAGEVVLVLVTCYVGDADTGEGLLAPLRGLDGMLLDTVAPIPYETMQGFIGQGFPHGRRNYWKTGLTNLISDAMIDAIVDFGSRVPSPHSAIVLGDCHGAFSRVAPDATAYRHRDLQFDCMILSSWLTSDDDKRNIEWSRRLFDAVAPELGRGVYVNDLGHDEDQTKVRLAYGNNYPRLQELKQVYDPKNLFRFNQNIPPV